MVFPDRLCIPKIGVGRPPFSISMSKVESQHVVLCVMHVTDETTRVFFNVFCGASTVDIALV